MMKRYQVVFIMFLLFQLRQACYSQPGVKIGLTTSSFTYTNTPPYPDLTYEVDLRPYLGYDISMIQLQDQNPLFSPYLSLFYSFNCTQRLSIRPELSFTQKGVSFDHSEYEKTIYKVKISYLELPISLLYKIRLDKSLSFDLYGGGFVACKIKGIKKTETPLEGEEVNQLDNVNDLDAGIHIGFATKYLIGNQNILFDIRVFQGFGDVFDLIQNDARLYNTVQGVKNTGINLSIGYEF